MLKLNDRFVVFTEPCERQTGHAWMLDIHAFLTDPQVRYMHPAEVGILLRAITAHLSGAQDFDDFVTQHAARYGICGTPRCERLWIDDFDDEVDS